MWEIFEDSEDLDFEKKHREWDWEVSIDKKVILENDVELESVPDPEEVEVDDTKSGDILVVCGSCGAGLSDEGKKVTSVLVNKALDPNDGISNKAIQKAQLEGLNIEYRCPKCRSCSDCRRSFETERVSLREEAEDAMSDGIQHDIVYQIMNTKGVGYVTFHSRK